MLFTFRVAFATVTEATRGELRVAIPCVNVGLPTIVPQLATTAAEPFSVRALTLPPALIFKVPLLTAVVVAITPLPRIVVVPPVVVRLLTVLFTFRAPPLTVKLLTCVDVLFSVRLPAETVTGPTIVPQLEAAVPFTTRPFTRPPVAIVRKPPCPLSELLILPELRIFTVPEPLTDMFARLTFTFKEPPVTPTSPD